tara:strand:- start:2481 stop:3104 length:624 start_codon:yes stop_codon:yes gene_type:complete
MSDYDYLPPGTVGVWDSDSDVYSTFSGPNAFEKAQSSPQWGGNQWANALSLASGFFGGGSSKSGGSTNVDKGGYLQQAKKEAAQEKRQQGVQKIFDNFYKEREYWEPQSNPQQFAQQYAAGMSGGGGGSSSGGNKIGSALGGAASGAQIGSMIAPGIGTAIGAGLGAIGGLFCDVRLKTDIAPLERSDVHDELAEMAFLVKEIRECA